MVHIAMLEVGSSSRLLGGCPVPGAYLALTSLSEHSRHLLLLLCFLQILLICVIPHVVPSSLALELLQIAGGSCWCSERFRVCSAGCGPHFGKANPTGCVRSGSRVPVPCFFLYLLSVSTDSESLPPTLWFTSWESSDFTEFGILFLALLLLGEFPQGKQRNTVLIPLKVSRVFVFDVLHCECDVPRCRFLGAYPTLCSLTFLDLFWCLSLVLENSQPSLLKSLFYAFFFLVSHYMYGTCSVIVPQFLAVFLLFLFFFAFQLGSFCRHTFKLTDSFFICVQSDDEPIKGFFVSVTVLWMSSSSFCFFLRVYISAYIYPSVFTCCLLFPLEPLAY